jgi:DNA-binding XRE family transcriptional regulator
MSLQEVSPKRPYFFVNWTNSEERLLKEIYPTGIWEDIQTALPRHTKKAIVARASKLRLKKIRAEPPSIALMKALTQRRIDLGMSQMEAAAIAGLWHSQLSRFECGASKPSVKSLLRLCEVLGVELCIRPLEPAA